ncbi:MAG: cytochrome D ubiquinol oxidase subunit II, partial [Planctomycetales bacterium]|nr:cytochrome D ubiquinol oxidase subunit II [Planctomycetales bacterium]
LDQTLLDGINDQFADIVNSGHFKQTEALAAEADEEELAHLPRLVFNFDRRNLGRLRQLINCINAGDLSPAHMES